MTEEIIKILGKEVVEIDGIKIETELRMLKDNWGEVVFKPYSRFFIPKSNQKILQEKYSKEIKELTKNKRRVKK